MGLAGAGAEGSGGTSALKSFRGVGLGEGAGAADGAAGTGKGAGAVFVFLSAPTCEPVVASARITLGSKVGAGNAMTGGVDRFSPEPLPGAAGAAGDSDPGAAGATVT